MVKPLYAILGVSKNADEETITKAYEKALSEINPRGSLRDRKHFKVYKEAYDTLIDKEKRALFDKAEREEEVQKSNFPSKSSNLTADSNKKPSENIIVSSKPNLMCVTMIPITHSIPPSGPTPICSPSSKPASSPPPETENSPIKSPQPLKKSPQQNKPKYHPLKLILNVSLEELYHGCTKRYNLSVSVRENPNGRFIIVNRTLDINIRPGSYDGQKLLFKRQGNELNNGWIQDVIFVIKQIPHIAFERVKDNLLTTMDLTLSEALIGFEKKFVTLDGRTITLRNCGGAAVPPGYSIKLKKEGMVNPKTKTKGDMIIAFNVLFPEKLTHKQIAIVAKYF